MPSEFEPRDPFDLDCKELHRPVYPTDIRTEDSVAARLRKSPTGQFFDVRVWKLSPLGVEIVGVPETASLSKGDPIDFEITLGGQRSYFEGLIVDLVKERAERRVYGIRLSRRVDQDHHGAERRKSSRWDCSDEFSPSCMASNPGRFNDFVYFLRTAVVT